MAYGPFCRGGVKAAISSNLVGDDSHMVKVGTNGNLIGFLDIHDT